MFLTPMSYWWCWWGWILTFWTRERVEQLHRLASEGKSGSQIAHELGTTRNAVIGKASRIMRDGGDIKLHGYCGGARPHPRHKPVKITPTPKPKPKPSKPDSMATENPPLIISTWQVEHTPGQKTFAELGPRDCRWTDSEGHAGNFLFCGAEKEIGRPYCAAHCLRAGTQYKPGAHPVPRYTVIR
jgi:GcrA cell cycle regulator